MSFKPSPEQERVVEYVRTAEHVAITAGAGTGKTSTLELCAASLKGKGLYVAFNKAIQREAEQRFPRHVRASTAHSLAWRGGGNRYKSRMDQPRLKTQEIVEILGARELTVFFEDDRNGSKTYGAGFVAWLASQMVKKFCYSADPEITTKHMPRIEGLDAEGAWTHHDQISPEILKLAQKAWRDIARYQGKLRFEHDHYLKLWQVRLRLDAERDPIGNGGDLGFDFLFADEAQDLSPVMIDVFQLQAEKGTQVIAVGDSNQSIYGWRGAVDGMGMVPGALKAELSWCWRFGEEIAVPVNRMLEQLDSPLRLVGKGSQGSVSECPGARVLLARTNAEIVRQAMASMNAGQRFAILGNLPRQVMSFARAARVLMDGGKTFHPELSWASNWGEVIEYVESDYLGADLALLVMLVEEFSPERIVEAMEAARDEQTAERVYATMHASKGREWPEVRLAGDYPVDDSGKPMMSPETMRLYYVAASRAMRVLDIDECVDVFYPPTRATDPEEGLI